jgi:hypothetical protein
MILLQDELNPNFGYMPVNSGSGWLSQPVQLFSQVTPTTLTAAATASVVTATSALGSATPPTGFLGRVGRVLRVRGGGYLTTAASGQGNITLGIYLGGACVATTPTIALAASQTKQGYRFEVDILVASLGSSGTVQASGFLNLGPLSAVLGGAFVNGSTIGTQAAQTPCTVNTTASLLVDVQSVLSAGTNTLVHTNTVFEAIF